MLERSILLTHSNNCENLEIHTIYLVLVILAKMSFSSSLSPVRERAWVNLQ